MAMMLYTYMRRRKTVEIGTATNAAPPSYRQRSHSSGCRIEGVEKDITYTSQDTKACSDNERSGDEATGIVNQSIAVFPQYVAKESTTLVMKEDLVPYLPGSFTVWTGNARLFEIDRERPSLTHRTNIIDAQSQELVMAVRKNLCNVPVSFTFEDPCGKRILDLQGEFFVPYSGSKSTAHMVNAETGDKIDLTMKGSYMNRHAIIKDESGHILVRMTSNIFEARNLVGHRRTYELTVQAGVDLSLAVAMILSLHEREQAH